MKKDQSKLKALEEKYKRALADYQNLQKRTEAQKHTHRLHASESLLDKLLPVLDDLERAQTHLKDSGLEMVIKQFTTVLKSEGLKVIDTDNQKFDPNTMDCTQVVKGKKDQVINTITKGYLYNDKVLRPARVEVGSGN